MSGGTLLAMAADEIIMDENAVLGPVDPQLGNVAAASVLKVLDQKPPSEIDDQTLVTADLARKAIAQVQKFVRALLEDDFPNPKIKPENVDRIIESLTTGHVTHDYPVSLEEATEMGLPVTAGLPEEIYALMDMYPQPMTGRPSVQYIPLPYQNPPVLPAAEK
jgi:ClpP class serine protease